MLGVKNLGLIIMAYNARPNFRGDLNGNEVEKLSIRIKPALRWKKLCAE